MAHKNISKKNLTFQNDFYETIVDIYNAGGCESVREYIDNNDIDSTEYNKALEEMLEDDNTDELFELMITHEKFKHTTVIDGFVFSFCGRNFKLDLVWKIKELDFYKKKMELNFYKMELKKNQEEIRQELSNELILSPLKLPQLDLSKLKPPQLDLSPLKLPQSELPQLDLSEFNKLYRSKIFRREKELKSEILFIERELKRYFDTALYLGNINALIKVLDYKPTLFEKADFSNLFDFTYNTDKYDMFNYILNNKNTKKVVTKNFIQFVDFFIKEESLLANMTEENFKKVLDVISKNVSEEEFKFLLEYLIREYLTRELVYDYGVKKTKYHYNIIELVKYIHDLYGDKIKISFNINYDYSYHKEIDEFHRYKDQIYDQMIFNGYEFLSTFASIFYEDLFFPKKDLINHIVDKNNLLKRKIKEGDVNRKDMIPYIEYKKTLSEFISNIHTIMKEIDSKQLEYLKTLIDDVNEIHDEMMDKYIHRLI